MDFKKDKTERGFAFIKFNDRYDVPCVIQKTSLATEDTIWLGIEKVHPIIMASNAEKNGVETEKTTGWVDFPVPEDVLLSGKMHLTKEQASELIKILNVFVETGELPE